ncbi:OLC1v1022370C1 [Oldenlandia corymbosa var. corymbosa]|uniref:OLC1v1022370C1 n=1 Tax=Oldenlandia corymbosa var. corymbosa TaxID=529605 RepID=A0AAV1BXP9_OLDCO|nr:OLC1v1022370C1 [Oldenlandia corymbosa var. corymbosa]
MAATQSSTFSSPASRSSALSGRFPTVKQVCLCDWWLVKADDSSSNSIRLGVAGINLENSLGRRIFHSAAILKRHSAVTLETLDGIVVNISGSINKYQTLQNGFPPEVCNHFLIGFPYYWEQYANQVLKSSDGAVSQGLSNLTGVVLPVDGSNTFSPGSIDDLPGSLLREFSLSLTGDSANFGLSKNIVCDILQKYGNRANDDENDAIVAGSSSDQSTSDESAAQQNHRGEDISSVTETQRKMLHKTAVKERIGFGSNASRKGPLTRSMSHSKTKRKKEKTVLTRSLLSEHSPKMGFKGWAAGKAVSDGTLVTRRLNLRNRSVELIYGL